MAVRPFAFAQGDKRVVQGDKSVILSKAKNPTLGGQTLRFAQGDKGEIEKYGNYEYNAELYSVPLLWQAESRRPIKSTDVDQAHRGGILFGGLAAAFRATTNTPCQCLPRRRFLIATATATTRQA